MGDSPAPRVVVASDSFKGSLGSVAVADAVRLGLLDVAPAARVVVVPVADGGEGTVAAALAAGWTGVAAEVHGPTGERVSATLAVLHRRDAVTVLAELADACGLGRLPGGIPAPLTASSRGLGEAVRAALDLGADEVVVGVGGSASTDGGAGLLAALGARLLDADGHDLPDGGAALADLARLDLSGLDPRLAATHLVLAADVESPLLGPTGAAAVFAPQKGATPVEVAALEAALTRWADVVAASAAVPRSTNRSLPGHQPVPRSTNRSLPGHQPVPRSTNRSLPGHQPVPRSTNWSISGQQPGAGAAGGVGFALLAVLGAERRSGVDVVLDIVGLDAALAGGPVAAPTGDPRAALAGGSDAGNGHGDGRGEGRADLVVTGEGALDEQTLAGKAVAGVARRAAAHGIPVVAVCGRVDLGDTGLAALPLRAAYPLTDLEPDPGRSRAHAAELLRRTGRRIAEDWLSPSRG